MRLLINFCQIIKTISANLINRIRDFLINYRSWNSRDTSMINLINVDNYSLQDNKVYSYRGWVLQNKNEVYYAMKDGRRIVSRHKGFKELESIIDFEESLR